MPKSKHRKDHTKKANQFKVDLKKSREILKKRMIDDFIKKQQEMMANKESHTSTKDAVGPEINIDDLNKIEDVDANIIEGVVDMNIDDINIDMNLNIKTELNDTNDNK